MSSAEPLVYVLRIAGEAFPVRAVRGFEAISTPFKIELDFALDGGLGAEPEELLKRGAMIEMERGGELVRGVAGVVTEVSASAVIQGGSAIHVVVEPQLALLRHRVDYRVFRDKTVPEIVEEVLAVVGIRTAAEGPSRLTLRLAGTYARRPYCVQCRESDLDFVHRLLEDDGIFYYFLEHDGLVLGDHTASPEPIAGATILPFRGGRGLDAHDGDAVTAIARRAKASVGKVSLRDFNLERPSLDLGVSAPGPSVGGPEFYDYPGEYADPAEGAQKAQRIAESYACAAATLGGEAVSARLAPGHTFTLEGSPSGVGEGRLLVTRVEHAWTRAARGFSCAFTAIHAETIFRPLRVTPAPRLLNPITGFVTGPAGQDIHTDALGRVKVHFHWDRLAPHDDDCSDWIPVLQDNTGHSVGIPRVGWEVLVHFLEGDPDRPVVLGRMYNAADNFPNALPAGKTKSALKSLSSPGRNGTNQIELDDLAGQEKVTVLAERNQRIVVANDKTAKVLNDEQIKVVRDERVAVDHNQTATVKGKFSHTIEGSQTRTVGGSRARTVDASETSTVVQNRRLTIGGMHQRKVGTDDVVQAKNLTESIGAVNLEAFVKTNTTTSGMTGRLTVGGALVEIARETKSESTSKARVETVGGLLFTKAGAGISTKVGKARVVTVGGAMTAQATGPLVLNAGKKVRVNVGSGAFKADSILLKVGETFVLLKAGALVINAAKTLTLDIKSANELGSPGIAIIPASMARLTAVKGTVSGAAAGASGSGKTGSGNVDVKGAFAAGAALVGAGPKGTPSPVQALTTAAKAGFDFDPKHCNYSLQETLRSYAEQRGIRQDTDGQAIPLSGQANTMIPTLEDRVKAYAAAVAAKDGSAEKQLGNGLAWEKVTREDAATLANQGELVVAGLPSSTGSGHVAAVVPGDGKKAGDGVVYPFVSGGGSGEGASDGSKTSGEVWRKSVRGDVGYYHFVAPTPPSPPPPAPAPAGLSI